MPVESFNDVYHQNFLRSLDRNLLSRLFQLKTQEEVKK